MGGGGGGGTYVPSLMFRILRSTGHASIFMLFVAILSALMSLFQGHVSCRNFTLTEPQYSTQSTEY